MKNSVHRSSYILLALQSELTYWSLFNIKTRNSDFPLCFKILESSSDRNGHLFFCPTYFCQFSKIFCPSKHRTKFIRLQDVKARLLAATIKEISDETPHMPSSSYMTASEICSYLSAKFQRTKVVHHLHTMLMVSSPVNLMFTLWIKSAGWPFFSWAGLLTWINFWICNVFLDVLVKV